MLRLVATLLLGLGPAAAPESAVEFTFADPAIVESSGLVVDDSTGESLFVTTNDSGDSGRVFTVDPRTGETVGVTTWSGPLDEPVDVEALAPAGPGEVWVADIGDNDAVRESVSVTRVPIGRGDLAAGSSPRYELVYPAGARDAETLLVDPDGRLLVVTKGLFGGEVYRTSAPLDPDRPNELRAVGVALPFATDGAFLPDGRHLLVRGYASAVVYAYPSLDEVGSFALPDQEQGEGVALDATGALFVSSEGAGSQVLRVSLPPRVLRAATPPAPSTPEPEPSPSLPATAPGADRSRVSAAGSEEGAGENSSLRWWALGGAAGLLGAAIVLAAGRALRPRG